MHCYVFLVMSLCSCDLHVTSLNNNYYNTLNNSRLTVVQLTQCLVFGWYNINLFFFVRAACISGKQDQTLFENSGRHSVDLLELVHSDVYGKISETSIVGA